MEKPYEGLALLTDLDGTLLLPDKTLSPVDAAAIADFRAKGGLFSVATGRGLQATKPYLTLFTPDFPAVMYNGALLYDAAKESPVAEDMLPKETVALLRELAEAFPDVGAEVLQRDGVFVFQDGEFERRHLEITHIPMVMRSLSEIRTEQCYKALFAGDPKDISRMLQYIRAPRFDIVRFTRSHDWFLELLPKGVSKGSAVQKLRTLLPEGTIIGTTGDFDNDCEMLREADYCGCPANAQPAVLKAVRSSGGYVSEKTCADGFFADWIAAFLKRCGR